MARLLARYDQLLQRHPLATKCTTSAVLFGVGDVLAQAVESNGVLESVDTSRVLRMLIWGGCIFAPLAHTWYKMLDKVVKGPPGAATVLRKVAADQLVWTPPINIAFFTYAALAEGASTDAALGAAQEKLWPTLRVNWVLWPVVQAVNFAVVPLRYRILVINCVSVGWSAFLSYVANQSADNPPQGASTEQAR